MCLRKCLFDICCDDCDYNSNKSTLFPVNCMYENSDDHLDIENEFKRRIIKYWEFDYQPTDLVEYVPKKIYKIYDYNWILKPYDKG